MTLSFELEIYTKFSAKDEAEFEQFERIRKKRWPNRRFLISGEWAASPINSGNNSLDLLWTNDRTHFALLVRWFPSQIVATAKAPPEIPIEVAGAAMLRRLRELEDACGFIDCVHQYGDFDFRLFWEVYTGRVPTPGDRQGWGWAP